MAIVSTWIISLLGKINCPTPEVFDIFIFRNIVRWKSFIPMGYLLRMSTSCAMPEKHFISRTFVLHFIDFYFSLIPFPQIVILYLKHFDYLHITDRFFKFFFYFKIITILLFCYIKTDCVFISQKVNLLLKPWRNIHFLF